METYETAERHRSLSTVLAVATMGLIIAGLTGFGIGVARIELARAHATGSLATIQGSAGSKLQLAPQASGSISDPAAVAARVTPAIVDINVSVAGG